MQENEQSRALPAFLGMSKDNCHFQKDKWYGLVLTFNLFKNMDKFLTKYFGIK